MKDYTITFLGCGVMGTAVASAIVKSSVPHYPKRVLTTSQSADSQAALKNTFKDWPIVETFASPEDNFLAVQQADIVVLGCKPYMFSRVLFQYKDAFRENTLLISLLAGTTIDLLSQLTPLVARIMTNTPAQYGCGTAAVALSPQAAARHGDLVLELAGTLGLAFSIPERNMDAATALVGSGPAFCMLMMELLMDGGIRMGLLYDNARLAAAKVMEGTAKMVLETGEHPAALKAKVCTPGGTTIGGLLKMEDAAVRSGIARAVEEAAKISASFR